MQSLDCFIIFAVACVWKNECKPLQSKWFDKESCRGYSCVLDVSDNDVKIIERTVGESSAS